MKSKMIKSNNINIHYIENEGGMKETIILMHGLSANAQSFNKHLSLLKDYRTIAVDLRGRGFSDKPNENYSMHDHAKDIIGLMDALDIQQAVLGGHSFGGLLSVYIAANYPTRVSKLIIMDAAEKLNPKAAELIGSSMTRLTKKWPSLEEYIERVKKAVYLKGEWNAEIEAYFKSDMVKTEDGSFNAVSSIEHISLAAQGFHAENEKWKEYLATAYQPAVLINSSETFTGEEKIVPVEFAKETVHMMKNCVYKQVSGNHITMLFGKAAEETVNIIIEFLNDRQWF